MCQLSDNCEMAFIVLFSFSLVARYCLSILITISMGFKNEVIILSIFSLLCTIFLTIVFFVVQLYNPIAVITHIQTIIIHILYK